jgi:hypothetical protein
MSKDTPLSVVIENGELKIKIGIDCLASAIARGNDFHRFDEKKDEYIRQFAITDSAKFTHDVARALQHEEEDGSTPLSKLLDEMGQAAIDDGSVGVEYGQSIRWGEKHPMETW